MDIIAAHRQGLIEQLDEEVAALAGRPNDHGQRAVVLHHLYDHSRGQFGWALGEARQALRIAAGTAILKRKLDRWGRLIGKPEKTRAAVEGLAEALGRAAAARTAAAYRAFRLSATAALRSEAEDLIPEKLLVGLDICHRVRRSGGELLHDAGGSFNEEAEQLAAAAVDSGELEAAWAAIDATLLRRAAHRLLSDRALAAKRARDGRRGWAKVERELRNDPVLPASFRANPAQHFYALQQMLRERRRQQWREACDREPDAFEFAA
jgi:hypothetical protein